MSTSSCLLFNWACSLWVVGCVLQGLLYWFSTLKQKIIQSCIYYENYLKDIINNINHGWGLIVCRAPFLSVIQQTPTCLHCKKDHFHLPIKTKHNVKTYMWTKIKRYENSYNNQNIDGNQCYGSGIRHVLKNNITQRGWESIFSFLNNFWLPGPQPSPPDTIHEYYKCIN